MINYCPSCGAKVEKYHKFCANCGTPLSQAAAVSAEKSEVIICKNCGEENPASNYECISCGIPLRKGRPEKRKERSDIPRQKTASHKPGQKSLDLTKIIAIFVVVVGIGLIILVATGVFDNPEPQQQNITSENQSSGVNLAAIQQINEMEKRVQAEPDNLPLLLELAHLQNDNGFADKAISNYRKYLEKNPSNPDARIDMGVCYYNLKQYDTAIAEMKKALEYKPDHQIGHLNLGIVNLAAGRLDESRNWLEKAAAINPDNEIGLRAKELLQNH